MVSASGLAPGGPAADALAPLPLPLAAEEARVRAAYARRGAPARESYFERAHLFMVQGQVRAVLRGLRAHGVTVLEPLDMLEVGCGTGRWLRELVQWGADPTRLTGVDVLADRIAQARLRCPAGVTLAPGNAAALALPARRFDVVLQSMVLSSVLDSAVRQRVAAEMLRVARPGGLIVSYDLRVRNPSNPDVAPLTRAQLRALFPGCAIRWWRVTLAPPLARLVAPRSWLLATLLDAVPALRTHWLAFVRVPAAAPTSAEGASPAALPS